MLYHYKEGWLYVIVRELPNGLYSPIRGLNPRSIEFLKDNEAIPMEWHLIPNRDLLKLDIKNFISTDPINKPEEI